MEGQQEEKKSVHGEKWWRGDMIGKGGFGSVYLATHKKPKTRTDPFPAQMAVKSAKVAVSGTLRKERKILSRLRGCSQVIQCFGEEITTGEKGEKVYNLLLEYASGGSLCNLMKKSEGVGFPEFKVKRYARSILQGIKRVHKCGYVHLDIKPANLLLVPISTTEFTVKICDFGMAKRVGRGGKTKVSQYIGGTAMYLSPEAINESIQEGPSDIWAIGCIVFEMLKGKRVWDRRPHWNTEKFLHMIGKEFGIPEIPNEITEEAKEFLKCCFVRKPEDRLSADMLLKLPFVASVDDDDDDEDVEAGLLGESVGIEEDDDEGESLSGEYAGLSEEEEKEPSICEYIEDEEEPSEFMVYEEDKIVEEEPVGDPYTEEEPSEFIVYEEDENDEVEPIEEPYEEEEPSEYIGYEEDANDEEKPIEDTYAEEEPSECIDKKEDANDEKKSIEDNYAEEEPSEGIYYEEDANDKEVEDPCAGEGASEFIDLEEYANDEEQPVEEPYAEEPSDEESHVNSLSDAEYVYCEEELKSEAVKESFESNKKGYDDIGNRSVEYSIAVYEDDFSIDSRQDLKATKRPSDDRVVQYCKRRRLDQLFCCYLSEDD